ncbi:MAG: SGNH/GDSL hydrolase family protein [Candidatus Hydrogenedentes bacterium]|nr:SGNH/GDSL hydrolase family protein [Candidatus Hydrogenedentota bacterium]
MLLLFLLCAILGSLELGARMLTWAGYTPSTHRLARDYGQLIRRGPEWIRFVPDDELSYRLRPGFSLTSSQGLGRTAHNGDGFRALSDFPPKTPNTLRICCFGGSTTYGVGVENNLDTYPAQLEELLEQAARNAGWDAIEVFNLGVGGYNSREILGTMARMIPALKPDVVLIQNAINDVIPRFYPDFQADYSHFRTNFSPLKLSLWHQIAYRSHAWLTLTHGLGWIRPLSLQSQTQRPMPPIADALANLEANPPTAFEDNLRTATALAQKAGAQVWLLTQPYLDIPTFVGPTESMRRLEGGYRNGLREHTIIVVALAAELRIGLVPLHTSMPRAQELFTDPIHMSPTGNVVKATQIAEAIGATLPKRMP